MCGIIGVTGEPDALPLLLGALHQLEYRGYDSAGVAMVVDGALWRARAAGGTDSVAKLAAMTADAPHGHAAAVGHTRWATHGSPTPENAHPHTDCTGRLGVVHNGIIENHAELQARLEADGHAMASATDTEVLAHLIEDHMTAGASLSQATRSTLHEVRGAFSVAVVHADEPDTIVAARRSTPLVLGLHDGMALLASDLPALIGHTRHVFALSDDELAVLTPGHLEVTKLDGTPVVPEELTITWDLEAAREGRLRGLHVEGDARAAPGRGGHVARPARPRRRAHPGRDAPRPGRPARHRQGVHRGLRVELPRRVGGQVRH